MKIRKTKSIPFERIHNILIRGTNWIGDVIMSLPAISATRNTFPDARITVLAKPWVADIYKICPDVDEVYLFEAPGIHDEIHGKIRLASELRQNNYDLALLLQNAIEAAIITFLARIPLRAGYNSDGRGLLLTHAVQRTKDILHVHQVKYYLEMVKKLGFQSNDETINLELNEELQSLSSTIINNYSIAKNDMLVGIAPGAAYGPAKMWYAERFAAVADRLADNFSSKIISFGSQGDRSVTEAVEKHMKYPLINAAGKTTLKEAIALMNRCKLFISNDSGLMHLAGALGIPLVAIFGSTNPLATSPPGRKSIIIRKDVECSPCLKKKCPGDFRCMDLIKIDDVYEHAQKLLLNTFS